MLCPAHAAGCPHPLSPGALMNVKSFVVVVCLSCVGLVGCGLTETPADRSREHLRRANYYLAFQELTDGGTAHDSSEYRAVELAYLMADGQDLVFNEREDLAIERFRRVVELDPGNAVAELWIQKSLAKLADRACRRGDLHRANGELREALLDYKVAMRCVADHATAVEGVAKVGEVVETRHARAAAHYYEGVQALGEQLWPQTWYHMVNAVEMDPAHEKARDRRDDVARRLAQQRYELAQELEESAHYGAALKEYLAIKERDPEVDGLEQRIAHMRKEVETERLVRAAEMAVFRREYKESRELLEQALEQTVTEQAHISDLLILVRERDFEERYEHAHVLELEHQLEEALAAYKQIAAVWEDFKDVKTLIGNLESAVDVATKAHARGQEAEKQGDLPAAIDAYGDALLVYPGYRKLDAKVAELKAKVGRGE